MIDPPSELERFPLMTDSSDIAFFDRIGHQFRDFLETQFLHDVGPMVFYRPGTDEQELGDIPVRFALRDQFKNFPLPGG